MKSSPHETLKNLAVSVLELKNVCWLAIMIGILKSYVQSCMSCGPLTANIAAVNHLLLASYYLAEFVTMITII